MVFHADEVTGDVTKKLSIINILYPGGVAQLGEHLPCKQGVASSILAVSTMFYIEP